MIKKAQKPSDIWEQMGDRGMNVGPRYGKNKRSNQDEELWCLRRLLDVLVEHNKIDWPLSVQQSDAPDFSVTENCVSYGLEVTQAISSEDARELTEAERSQSGVYFIGDFGGRKPASKLETAAEFTFNIQSVINKKSQKPYVISNQTDLRSRQQWHMVGRQSRR